jgi:molybdopterin converting factor small subunit
MRNTPQLRQVRLARSPSDLGSLQSTAMGDPAAASGAFDPHQHDARALTVRVLFFAKGREVAGTSEQTLQLHPGATTEDLIIAVVAQHPGLSSVLKTCVLAHNQVGTLSLHLPRGDLSFPAHKCGAQAPQQVSPKRLRTRDRHRPRNRDT